MPRFVTLLRGVNVGRGNRVPMAELRSLLASLGYTNVRTLLNSGNAVFESSGRSTARHAARIRKALAETFGVTVPVIVKSERELSNIRAENSLTELATDPSRLLVVFASEPKEIAALAALVPLVRPPEALQIGSHAAYLWCPHGILESEAAAALLGKQGKEVTTRNWATVLKLAALVASPS